MAMVNFVNLATARASQRAREVALRKVLGASRRQLVAQREMPIRESIALMALAGCASPAPAAPLALPPFTAVELHDGGEVIVRHGPAPRVELAGNGRTRDISVRDGRFVIGHCRRNCGERHGGPIEVEMPRIDAASVTSGGSIEVTPGFPAQPAVEAAVHHGGVVDIRGLAAGRVTATIDQGGLILTDPGERLDASVSHGGVVTYWGRPAVRRSVRGGGDVVRGEADDADRPLAELRPAPPAPHPPIPPRPAAAGLQPLKASLTS